MHAYKKIDAWELRKLGDYAEILTGGTPKTSVSEYWEPKKIPWMSSGEVNKRRLDGTDNMISEEGLNNSSARWVKKHSVLIALAGQGKTRGTVAVNNIQLTTNQSIAAIVPNDNLHYEFIYQNLIKRYDELRMISSGDGTRGGLNKQIVSDIVIPSPSKDEQIKIGTFFKQLDNTIALHQRKLDALKMMKKALLQQMFPENGEKTPRLRFADFEEEWEQRKLGEIVERVIRKNKNLKSTLPLTISAKEGLIDQNEFFNKTVASRDVSGYYLVKNGEFAYNKSYSNGYPWGAIKRLNHYDMGVLSTLYIVFKPTNINSDFLEKYYDTTYWHKEISKHATEGARNHGLLNIAATVFFESKLTVPKDCDEQEKVGMLFCHLDETIILYQKKLNQFYKLKKAYLQKMFI